MNPDLSLISAVLRSEQGYFFAKREGVSAKWFQGENLIKGWKFIEDHVLEFGKTPSEDLFCARMDVALIDAQEDLPVLIAELRTRLLWNHLRGVHEKAGDLIAERRPDEAMEVYQQAIQQARRDKIAGSKIESLLSLGNDVITVYERMKRGDRGILTPWDAINDMTLGWWDGDFVVFVARMGVGKTFAMLMLARQAWMDGKKVLFVGTEMSQIKLATRFFAIHLKLPYNELRHGTLGEFREHELIDGVKQIIDSEGLYVVGDDFDSSLVEIEAAVEEIQPDILFVDGIYLVKNEGRDRHTRVSNTADDLKRLARRRSIPVIASTQFNRDVATNSKSAVSSGNVGITDVIGWDADVMFGMYQTEDMEEDNLMGFRPMKLREGKGRDFFSHWKFDEMVFDQADVGAEAGEFNDSDYNAIPGESVEDVWGNGADDQGDLF